MESGGNHVWKAETDEQRLQQLVCVEDTGLGILEREVNTCVRIALEDQRVSSAGADALSLTSWDKAAQ